MSDITGSVTYDGVKYGYDINPTADTAKITVGYGPVTFGSVNLSTQNATAKIGGSVGTSVAKTTVEAQITADWTNDKITYSTTIKAPGSKSHTYTGTIYSW